MRPYVTGLSLCLLAAAFACKPIPSPAEKPRIDIEDPSTCAGCHQAVVAEWRESMHARAHHSRDPIYGAIRALRLKKEGPEIATACAKCHTPRSQSDPEAALGTHGVSCAACHQEGQPGMMVGPHDIPPGRSPVHGVGPASPDFKDGSSVCLRCHDALHSPQGVPICTTGPEWRAEEGQSATRCVDCHMPEVQQPSGSVTKRKSHRSHIFAGPHRAWYQDDSTLLKEAATVSGRFVEKRLELTVANRTGHALPSGFPGRVVTLELEGKDAGGKVVWEKSQRFGKRYVDAEGKPTLAPWAAKLAEDTRLEAGERRALEFTPPATVQRVSATLQFRLLPASLAKKAGIGTLPEAEPRALAPVIFERSAR